MSNIEESEDIRKDIQEETDEDIKKEVESLSLKEVAEKASSMDGMSEKAISHLLSDNTVDNMKAFLVILAKKELKRVVKLIDSLGSMEDDLIDLVTDRQKMGNIEPGQMAYIIRTLHKSLERSMELINSIVEDEKYYNFIIDNSQNKTVNNLLPGVLEDSASRERVRDAVQSLIKVIDSGDLDKTEEALQSSEIIDISENNKEE